MSCWPGDFEGTPYAVYEAGEAVVDHEISRLMTSDIARLLPLVVAVVAAFLFISLRSVAGVVYPLATVLLSSLWCLGFMGLIDLPISIVGTVLPVLLVAVGSAYGIHFVHYFNEMRADGLPRNQVVRSAIDITGMGGAHSRADHGGRFRLLERQFHRGAARFRHRHRGGGWALPCYCRCISFRPC